MKGRQDIQKHRLNPYQPVHSIENPVSYWPDDNTRLNSSMVSDYLPVDRLYIF